MDGYTETLEGVRPGQPGESELLKRARLPLDHEDHMPPMGKPQPTPAELAVLEWWITIGAPEQPFLRSLHPPPPVRRQLGLD